MNPAQLLAHFDRISNAPDAVPRLRRFILDLAVRGKLVEQDSGDEPASDLLKQIRREKKRLLENGEMRSQVDLEDVSRGDVPFTLPASWQWVRLIDLLTKLTDGTHHSPPNHPQGDFKYITAKNIKPDGVTLENVTYIDASIHHDIYSRCNPEKGDLLYIKDGATTGVVTINNLDEPFSMLSSVALLKLAKGVYSRLLVEFLRSPFFYEQMRSFMKGAAITRLTMKRMAPALVPLPPLKEQHRIVAKVDELMGLCDRLEAAQGEREERRDRLNRASLHRLNNGADAGAFRDHARFHLRHLPLLTTRPEHIRDLRQTILNLAVRGKLVRQKPHDEPASEVLDRIQAKKSQLMANGEIKKDKELWDGRANEPPFMLPTNWHWAQIQDVFEVSRGGSPRPAGDPRFFGGPIPWITVREITKDALKYLTATESGLTEEGSTRSRFIDPGDLLLTNSGATLGVPKISRIRACMNDGVALLRLFHKEPLNDFAYLYLQSQTEAFRQVNQGMGQPNLNTPIIAGWYFPLPPIAEQHRIVAKVDELMKLCDQLESQLTTTQTETRRLVEALLHEALESAVVASP